MNDAWNALSPVGAEYLERVRRAIEAVSARDVAARIIKLVQTQERERRQQSLNLNAAEGTISLNARRLLDSDLATRLAEGVPGDRLFPVGRQNACVDELEAIIIAQVRHLFRAEYVEWRATSTTMANTIIFVALTNSGDTILVQSMEGGGNMSYHEGAIPTLRGLSVHHMPAATDYFEVDVEGVRELAHKVRPAMLVVGGSYVLFPYPVRELRAIADEVGALLLYDAAHVALLIAAGQFQDPLAEGAHVLSMSTHKIMGGPIGGLVVTNDASIATRLWRVPFPQLMQTRDQNKLAATAYALTEMTAHSVAYAGQIVANARALAEALEYSGLPVVARERGYTMTHQIFVDAIGLGARHVESVCNTCNILLQASHMRGDSARGLRTGLRLSVQEITRQGMKQEEMRQIAGLVRRALDGEPPGRVAADVAHMARQFSMIQFSFDT